MIFQYYPADIKQTIPIGTISLDRFIQALQNPKEETKQIFNLIKLASDTNDISLKHQLKSKLYYFTPCVFVEGNRRYENIVNFTGLLALDFDKLEIDYCIKFKNYLFNKYKFIIACWISPSARGVRALVSIPKAKDVNEYKDYYNAIEKDFKDYNGFDKAVKNPILPMFLSYDPDILHRNDYTTWNKKVIIEKKPIVEQYIVTDKSKLIAAIAKSSIDKINDNGHPQLRAIAFAMGGYIGAGYIDSSIALSILTNLINTNDYLNKKPHVYIQTAKDMLLKGQSQPLYIQDK
jgi:hypothetical protein